MDVAEIDFEGTRYQSAFAFHRKAALSAYIIDVSQQMYSIEVSVSVVSLPSIAVSVPRYNLLKLQSEYTRLFKILRIFNVGGDAFRNS